MTTEKAPTPLSDAAAFRASGHFGKGALVLIDDARELERESIRLAERLKKREAAMLACATHLKAMARRNPALDPGVLAVAMDLDAARSDEGE